MRPPSPFITQAIAEAHRSRLVLVSALAAAVAVAMLLVDYSFLVDPNPDPAGWWYLFLDLGLLLLNLGAFAAVIRRRKGIPLGSVVAYAVPVLGWAVATGVIDYQRGRDMAAVLLTVFAASAFGLFTPALNALLLTGTVGTYLALLFFLPGTVAPSFEDCVTLVVLAPLSIGVSTTLYRAFVTHLEDRARIQEAQLNLIRQEKLAAMGVLSAGIAHEVNNPLGVIRSNVGVLERNVAELTGPAAVQKENAEIFADIDEAFRRIGQVVDALRTFGRASDDGAQPYLLDEGVRTTLRLSRAEARDIEVRTALGGSAAVPARAGEINQVILNLLMNAYQAVRSLPPEAPRWLAVETRNEPGRVVLEVANSGPPVAPEVRRTLFEPFVSTKGTGEGMGLGLSLAWEIVVHRHGGALELLPGDPVRFRLTLPQLRTQST